MTYICSETVPSISSRKKPCAEKAENELPSGIRNPRQKVTKAETKGPAVRSGRKR